MSDGGEVSRLESWARFWIQKFKRLLKLTRLVAGEAMAGLGPWLSTKAKS